MRRWWYRGAMLVLAGWLAAGCEGTSSSSGASGVTITGEDKEPTAGNSCAIEGHATNAGNLRVNVTIKYEAKDANGTMIGTSTAFFQIAPFSDFDFGPAKNNHLGQPSSGTFSNNLSCTAISDFKRVDLDVEEA